MSNLTELPVRTAAHLTRAQRVVLEAELRRELARLERIMAVRRASGTTPVDDNHALLSPDAAEHADAAPLLARRSATHHAAVVGALNRLAQGTYGICAVCREPIPYGRLLAMPETSYCVSCGRVR